MIDIITAFLILNGVFFVFVGSLGVYRFEDVFLRLQASSKALTFGLGGVVLGSAMATADPLMIAKAILIILFQFITSPIAAQMIARAAIRSGIYPCKLSHIAKASGEIIDTPPQPEERC